MPKLWILQELSKDRLKGENAKAEVHGSALILPNTDMRSWTSTDSINDIRGKDTVAAGAGRALRLLPRLPG